MKFNFWLLSLSLTLVLSACGGSSSSSSGSGGDTAGDNQYAGTYSGRQTVTFSNGDISIQESIFQKIKVNGDGSFTIVDQDEDIPVTGRLNGDSFDASGSGTSIVDGVRCSATVNYKGRIVDNAAKGNYTGSGRCSQPGETIDITISGPFDLPKTTNVKQGRNSRGGSLFNAIGKLIR